MLTRIQIGMMHMRTALLIALLWLLLVPAVASTPPAVLTPWQPTFFILTSAGTHYPKLDAALSVVGYVAREGTLESYTSTRQQESVILVVPQAESQRLSREQVAALRDDILHGQSAVLEGASTLAGALGVTGARLTRVKTYRWHRSPGLPIRLLTPLALPRCHLPAGAAMLARAGRLPLLASLTAGRGKVLFTALPLEPPQSELYQHNLFLLNALSDTFALQPAFAAIDLGVFVDWGYHAEEKPAVLAARLHAWHIRRVAFSAWYDNDDYRQFTRDFLAAAHREGLLVEAWFELPMVSIPFWQQHPEWREVTAAGTPAQIDWRSLMALEDPQCLAAVEEYLSALVRDFDWDGVNCAELYFESPGFGLLRPDKFTPMHPAFRRDFQRDYGVDPLTLFDAKSPNYWKSSPRLCQALQDSRTALIVRLHEELLRLCARWREQKPYLHTTFTLVDSLLDARMTKLIGVDSAQLLAFTSHYSFLPIIEDPYTLWGLGADRYRVLMERYRPLAPSPAPLAVDINIAARESADVPTPVQRGLEFYSLIAAAETHADITYLYADNSLDPADMSLAVCALGSQPLSSTPDGQTRYTAARPVLWRLATDHLAVSVDGSPWPCLCDDGVLLPAGTHTVSARVSSDTTAGLRIEDITGTLLQAQCSATGISVHYRSDSRCFITLNETVQSVRCDGQPWDGQAQASGNKVVYAFPGGEHAIEFTTASGK